MTRDEIRAYFTQLHERVISKKSSLPAKLASLHREITAAYGEYENTAVEEFNARWQEVEKDDEAWRQKRCLTCGKTLRFIESGSGAFWGCPAFNDGRQHKTYNQNFEEILENRKQYLKVRIDKDWLTHILRKLRLAPGVAAGELLKYFQEHGMQDLRVKYERSDSSTVISGYVRARNASREEEQEIVTFFKAMPVKAVSQLYLRYKLEGREEKVAIIDLVVSDDCDIFIIEIKRNASDIVEGQLQLYHQLIQHLCDREKKQRVCRACFLVYNKNEGDTSSTSRSPYLSFNDVRDKTAFRDVKKEMLRHVFI